ncbi:YciI family protein [Stakelama tenebrarum]|uniref:GTP cyclohydrolase n=1 Tax=Stakelama tenebrarum TaxID=2711215 RepID=A0A6G6Y8A3_9SPHN|nr:YciI family protein [Sphingosinithalassobacter tenebrarum]QIG81155.1 GTP cyclohydrolase [Sphingosinithalassobacter tenebrarum]
MSLVIVELTYKVDPAEITELRPAHLEWLREGLMAGRLALSGRKMPVTGGMLIVRGTVEEAQAWCASDPFALADVAEYRFFAFEPSLAAPGLESLLP